MMLRGTPGACSRTAQQGAQEMPALLRRMRMLLCQHSRSKVHLHFQVLVILKWAYKTVIARHGILGSQNWRRICCCPHIGCIWHMSPQVCSRHATDSIRR